MSKPTEKLQNIELDTDFDDNFDKQIEFTNPRARFRAHRLKDSSDEEPDVNIPDSPQP